MPPNSATFLTRICGYQGSQILTGRFSRKLLSNSYFRALGLFQWRCSMGFPLKRNAKQPTISKAYRHNVILCWLVNFSFSTFVSEPMRKLSV